MTTKTKKDKEIEKLKREIKEELKKEIQDDLKENMVNDDKKIETKVKEVFDKIMDTKDSTESYDKKDIENNKFLSVLSYFGPLAFIPFFVGKESKFVQFHAKQGINLFIVELIMGGVVYFLNLIFQIPKICSADSLNLDYICGMELPLFVSIPLDFLQVILGIVALIGVIYSCQGKAKEIPILCKFKILK